MSGTASRLDVLLKVLFFVKGKALSVELSCVWPGLVLYKYSMIYCTPPWPGISAGIDTLIA